MTTTVLLVAIGSAWVGTVIGYGIACLMHIAAEADRNEAILRRRAIDVVRKRSTQ